MTDIGIGQEGGIDGEARSPLIASDRVEGAPVRRGDGDEIGRIERLMIDKRSGRVAYAVMSFGGFLGLGEDYTTLPWGALRYDLELDAYRVEMSDDDLRRAPRRASDGRDPSIDRDWNARLEAYWAATPYWGI